MNNYIVHATPLFSLNISSIKCDAVAFLAQRHHLSLSGPSKIKISVYHLLSTMHILNPETLVEMEWNYLEVFFFTIVDAAACF